MPLDREQGGDDDDDAYAHLLGQLEMRQRQLTEAEETVQLFKEKLEKLRVYNDSVVTENSALQGRVSEVEELLGQTQGELERAFQEQKSSRAQWKVQLETQADEMRRLHRMITTQEDIEAEKLKIAGELEIEWGLEELRRYNRKMAAIESRLASSRQKCAELQRELDQEKIRNAMERQDADAALKKAREEVKGEEETLQRKLREAELEMRRYAEQVSAIPKLKAQVFEMGAKMKEGSALVASLKEQHEETVATLQARIEVQRAEILQRGKEARDALAEKAKTDRAHASLTEESARRGREIERLETSVTAMKRAHEEEKKALRKESEKEMADLRSQLAAQEGCVGRLEKELDRKCRECCEQVNRAAEQVNEAERRVSEIQRKFDEETARVTMAHEAEVCELHRRLAGMNTACAEAKQTISELEAALRSVEDRNQRALAEKEDKAVIVASSLEQARAQMRAAEDKAAEFEQMARDYTMLQSKHRETLAHLTNTVEKLEEKEMSISALKAELKDVNRAHEYERHKAAQDAEQWAREAQETRLELLEMSRHSQAVAEELRRTRSYAKKVKAKNKQKVKEAHTKVSTTNGKLKELVRLQGHIEKRASESKVSYEQRIADLERRLLHATFGGGGGTALALASIPALPVSGSSSTNGYNAFVDMPAPASLFRHTTVESARRHRRVRDRKTRQHVDAAAGPSTIAEESKENQATTQPSQEEDDVDLAESHLWPAEHANQ
ncbi:Filamin-A-interacting protein, putative [Perkinsus marinus ATCC 50983]|uniref:Filamin-A-interacting protein, putative n=1 Tax=Perkinsus marinus (strain ATCC 50983 / TXsc) TaxID=423536 RepID=C5LTH0_PERM5|nr:Filamin-A-interacting protein, putative [Perkinsus marinus ATCC 50983]EEQ99961.1 Filamin-A-interacting protein, putative [Perkinsus marinus ATCC 50983]|eukprot:XP_002767244.1 Filamin-A-interacting protein, putative [Perkinsus marinus ATCC 50983]